jgi:hypothetical protein
MSFKSQSRMEASLHASANLGSLGEGLRGVVPERWRLSRLWCRGGRGGEAETRGRSKCCKFFILLLHVCTATPREGAMQVKRSAAERTSSVREQSLLARILAASTQVNMLHHSHLFARVASKVREVNDHLRTRIRAPISDRITIQS